MSEKEPTVEELINGMQPQQKFKLIPFIIGLWGGFMIATAVVWLTTKAIQFWVSLLW